MLGQKPKGYVNIKCNEPAFPEFPDLLFGTQIETHRSYFDATLYLQKQKPDLAIRQFFVKYQWQIKALCDAYEIQWDDVTKINEDGHYLIEGNFVYLYISFVEPDFLAYICDRIHELFTNGVTVSDSYLLQSTKARISPEILSTIIENDSTQG